MAAAPRSAPPPAVPPPPLATAGSSAAAPPADTAAPRPATAETVAPLTGLARAVAAVRSVATYLAVSLYVAVVGPPALLVAALVEARALVHVLGRQGVRLSMLTSGIRWRLEGREHDPGSRPAIFCANHRSNVDAPLLFLILRPGLRAVFKAELQKLPILGRAMLAAGFIPVERRHREQAMAAIDRATECLRQGDSFLVFPEGTRSRTDDLLPFKKGSFVMAINAQVPIVPVAITGGRAAMAKGSFLIRPVTIRVRLGEPVETAGMTLADRERLIAEVRGRLQRLLDETGRS